MLQLHTFVPNEYPALVRVVKLGHVHVKTLT